MDLAWSLGTRQHVPTQPVCGEGLHYIDIFAVIPFVKEAELGCTSRFARHRRSSHDRGQVLQLHFIPLLQNDSHSVGFPEHGQYG